MRWRDRAAERAGRRGADHSAGVGATSRAGRNFAGGVQLDIGRQVGAQSYGGPGCLASFESELIGRPVNLAEVVDAGVGLRGGTGFHEVRNRNCRQQADNGHDDHDFHQGEARLTDVFGLFHLFCFLFVTRRNVAPDVLYDYDFVPLIAWRNRVS